MHATAFRKAHNITAERSCFNTNIIPVAISRELFFPVSFREQAEFNEPMYISHSACYRELTSPTNLLSAKYSVLHRRASDPFRYCFCGSNRIKEMQTKANTEIDLKRKLFFP